MPGRSFAPTYLVLSQISRNQGHVLFVPVLLTIQYVYECAADLGNRHHLPLEMPVSILEGFNLLILGQGQAFLLFDRAPVAVHQMGRLDVLQTSQLGLAAIDHGIPPLVGEGLALLDSIIDLHLVAGNDARGGGENLELWYE